ncbi:MAG: RecX family transcriptional regulator [Lacibacter sp.]|jgi:regulatory protein
MYRQQLTREQALQKAKHYCAYQERCHSEVKEKLYSFGLRKTDVEQVLTQLIDEDYLNEERFAIQFAGGKFRMKQWGRVKIKYELKQKGVSEYCIKKALKEIDEEAYRKTLRKLFDEKMKTLRSETNQFIRKRKLQDYLLQKGYEAASVQQLLANDD